MSLKSKIKGVVSKVLNTIGSYAGSSVASATNALRITGPLNPSPYSPKSTNGPLQIYETKSTPQGDVSYGKNNPDIILGGITYYNAQGGGNAAYNTLAAGGINSGKPNTYSSISPNTIGPGAGRGNGLSNSPTIINGANSMNVESRMSPSTLGVSSAGSSSLSAGSVNTSSPSLALPSTPYYSNPGKVDNTPLYAGSPDYLYDPATGIATLKEQPNEVAAAEAKYKDLLDKIPSKQNVNDDPEVRRQQAVVQARQQEVNDYTSQLNSVVAKQQADLLSTRGTASKEGVTEAVYGGIEAQINREAAIKALPIQAALAGAQGNLGLAQDYLSQVTKIRQEDIDNHYSYKTAQYNAIAGFVEGEQKTRLAALTKKNDRAYQEARDNVADQDAWAKLALSNGQPKLIPMIQSINPNSPTFRQDLARVTAGFVDKDSSKGSGGTNSTMGILDVQRYNELYPGAGVVAGDTEAQANAKVAVSNSPAGQLKVQIEGFKQDGSTYKEVIENIFESKTIQDKTVAVKVADEVFGIKSHSITDKISSFIFSN